MNNVPTWSDFYVIDYEKTDKEVKKFYQYLIEKINKGEYVKISEYEGENS